MKKQCSSHDLDCLIFYAIILTLHLIEKSKDNECKIREIAKNA